MPDGNPSFYEILEEYYKLTGVPSLVNTSFNMHESPIVATAADAIQSFREGRLDYLAIGPYLVKEQGAISRRGSERTKRTAT